MRDFFRLWRYIKPYKYNAVANITLNFFSTIFALFSLSLIIPFLGILFGTQEMVMHYQPIHSAEALKTDFYYFLSQLILNHGKSSALLLVVVCSIAASLLKNALGYFASFNMAPIINGVMRDIQLVLYRKVLQLPLSYYSDEKKGNIMARITNDVEEIKFSIMSTLDMLFRDPLTIIIYLIVLMVMNTHLTLIVLSLLPFIGIVIGTVGRKLRSQWAKSKDRYGALISIIEETIGGLKIIKAFGAEKKIDQRFTGHINEYTKLLNKLTRLNSLATPLSEFLGMTAVMFILYYGSNLVINHNGSMSPQSFIGYLIIFSQVITPAKSLSNSYYNIQKGLASLDRINVIIKADLIIKNPEVPVAYDTFNSSIEFKNVSFKYKDRYVLKDVCLTIEKGQTVALVGHSGSGKSTMVDLVPRFWDVEEGEISIDGIPVKAITLESLRRQIGYVNQEPILFNDSIFNNIAFGLESTTMEDVVAAAKVANAHDFIMETPLGYETNIGDRGNKLSGGQRQRLSIARAVIKNPPILILDEATSALDTESERLVQNALTNLMKNRTSLVIAHRLSTITHSDVICVLRDGEIVERGTYQELIDLDGYYKKLNDMQAFQA
jgi:ABC-type multidrug transport system fused ATPase/permease subunit